MTAPNVSEVAVEGENKSFWTSILRGAGRFFAILISFLLALFLGPLILLLVSPIYLARGVVAILARCARRSTLAKMLTARSAFFAGDAIYMQPLMVNAARFILQDTCDLHQLEKTIDQNWLQARASDTNRLKYSELKQYVTTWLGWHFWAHDENFNVKNHVKLYLNQEKPGHFLTDAEVNDAWNELTMKPFEGGRSPWEVFLIPYYRENPRNGDESLKSVMIFRWHHCLCDGFSILNLLKAISTRANCEDGRQLDGGGAGGGSRNLGMLMVTMWKAMELFVTSPFVLIQLLTMSHDKNAWHLTEKRMTRYWHLGVGRNLPIQLIQEVKGAFGVSFTCVLLTAVAGALRKTMMKAFEMNSLKTVPEGITCGVPFPLPKHPDKLRNHWAICTIALPVGEENPLTRIRQIERNVKILKDSANPTVAYGMVPFLGGMPALVIAKFVTNRVTTAITSIMPGPPEPMCFLGNPILDAAYVVGCGPGRNGFSFTVLSYGGNVKFAITVDSAISPEEKIARDLMDYIEEELLGLKQLCVHTQPQEA